MTRFAKLLITIICVVFAPLVVAAMNGDANVTSSGADTSLGQAATSVTTLISHAHEIIEVVLIFCAIAMATSAFLKYRLHRRNPQQVPLSTPVLEAVIAAVLFAMPFVIEYSSSAEVVETAKPIESTKYYHLAPNQGQNPTAPAPPTSPYPY